MNIFYVCDLLSMLIFVVGKFEVVNGFIFNCVFDWGIIFDGLVKMCVKVVGKEVKIVYYDFKVIGVDVKKVFLFCNMVCYFGLFYILVIILG